MFPRGALCSVHLHKQRSMLTSQSFRIWGVGGGFSWFRGEYQKLTSVTCHLAPFQPPVIQNISSKKAEKSGRKSRSVVSDSFRHHGLYSPWNSPDQNTGGGSLSRLQGIFPTQGSNPDIPHCGQILYQLSHKGSPITEVGSLSLFQQIFPSRELKWVSCIAGGFFTT